MDRSGFLKSLGAALSMTAMRPLRAAWEALPIEEKPFPPEEMSTVLRVTDGDPERATLRLLDLLGGISALIGQEDIVLLKPNSQWWLQGMTNTDVLAAFIEAVVTMPGFRGEVIVADNHQSKKQNSRGWTTKKRNGKYNLNELIDYFQGRGYQNVSKYHWHPAGPNPNPLQMAGAGNSVVQHPAEGDGYIWPEELFYRCPYGQKTLLSYPVFTSGFSGVTIDFKNGAFLNGDYTGQTVKFINFSAINHHSYYGGVTASVKNLMGVVDMTCGYPAPHPNGTFNTHHIGASPLFRAMANRHDLLKGLPGFYRLYHHPSVFRFQYTGGVLGAFMKNIRRPDLNIITAIRSGWGSRTDPAKASQTDTILASRDPVALDFIAADQVLMPATREVNAPAELQELNNPRAPEGRFRMFLQECRREIGGTLSPEKIKVVNG